MASVVVAYALVILLDTYVRIPSALKPVAFRPWGIRTYVYTYMFQENP